MELVSKMTVIAFGVGVICFICNMAYNYLYHGASQLLTPNEDKFPDMMEIARCLVLMFCLTLYKPIAQTIVGTMASEVTSVVSATTQIAKQILNMSLSQVKVHLKANYQMYIQEETKESKLKRQAVQAELQRLYEEMAQQEPVKSHPLQTLIDKL